MRVKKVLAAITAVTMCATTCVACSTGSQGGVGGDDTLNIRVWDGGYGLEWIDSLEKEFEKKYDIKVNVKGSSLRNQLAAEMKTTNPKNQKYDLFFTDITIGKSYLVDLSDVYSYKTEGEDKKISEKFHEAVDESYLNEDGTYYYMPWGVGASGITYNADLITEDMIPNTTDELVALCEEFKDKGKYSFTFGNDTNYWDGPFMEWWAQYEGIENFKLYYYGKTEADGVYTSDVLSQQGRLRSLEVLETLLGYENGYTDPASSTLGFMSAQKNYFEGKSVMMYNGAWIENEMSELFPDGCPFTIDMMKTPIISSIVEQLDTVDDDAMLSAIVDYVDGKSESAPAGVSEEDIATIRAARGLVSSTTGHNAIIPKSAAHIENAKTFLKFMYSDLGINTYMKNSNGSALLLEDFEYGDWLNDCTRLQQSCLNRLNEENIEYALLPRTDLTVAGLSWRKTSTYLELLFCAQNKKDRWTAQEVFQYDIDYYTANNGSNWNQLLKDAGIE